MLLRASAVVGCVRELRPYCSAVGSRATVRSFASSIGLKVHNLEEKRTGWSWMTRELATQYGRYGYRRISGARWYVKGWRVNHKRVERSMAS